MSFPNEAKIRPALSKLKFLVIMDPLQTETARFWENHGEYNDVEPAKIQTDVFELPTTCFAEDEGSLTNSGRWLQWHWAGADAAGRGQVRHLDHGAALQAAARRCTRRKAALPGPDPQSDLALYRIRTSRRRTSSRKEING